MSFLGIASLRKKRKREGKREKRERKRKKKGKEKKEKGNKEEIGKKNEKDDFWLSQENKQNLFGEKIIFSPQGERISANFSATNLWPLAVAC